MTTQTRDTTLRDRAFLIESVVSNILYFGAIVTVAVIFAWLIPQPFSMLFSGFAALLLMLLFTLKLTEKRQAFRLWIWDTLEARKRAFPNE